MRTIIQVIVTSLLLIFAFSACGPRNPSASQLILGKWDIDTIELTDDQNAPFVNSEGWIKFHTDNTFDSQGEPHGIIDGAWKIDEESEVLSITVNQNLSDKSTWDLSVDKKKMEWFNETLNVTLDLSKS